LSGPTIRSCGPPTRALIFGIADLKFTVSFSRAAQSAAAQLGR